MHIDIVIVICILYMETLVLDGRVIFRKMKKKPTLRLKMLFVNYEVIIYFHYIILLK